MNAQDTAVAGKERPSLETLAAVSDRVSIEADAALGEISSLIADLQHTPIPPRATQEPDGPQPLIQHTADKLNSTIGTLDHVRSQILELRRLLIPSAADKRGIEIEAA